MDPRFQSLDKLHWCYFLLHCALILILCPDWKKENWSGRIIQWAADEKCDNIRVDATGHLDCSKKSSRPSVRRLTWAILLWVTLIKENSLLVFFPVWFIWEINDPQALSSNSQSARHTLLLKTGMLLFVEVCTPILCQGWFSIWPF